MTPLTLLSLYILIGVIIFFFGCVAYNKIKNKDMTLLFRVSIVYVHCVCKVTRVYIYACLCLFILCIWHEDV